MRYHTDPDWYEYRLTKAGLDLFPALLVLKEWGDRYLPPHETSAIDCHRHTCGADLTPIVVCSSCGEPVSASDVDYEVATRTPATQTSDKKSMRLLGTRTVGAGLAYLTYELVREA